ncbi:Aldehyde dehydrogenase [Sulfitobacter noctilucicola]|uniref:DNA helicase HerA-like ATPase n=1 Tax=Sulfitobacter noctilucicola TaxID=1342301 RepID=A0A7W6M7V3_9RHOB|nr:aldehyde dehydrogenase family protein [Sulfitobacter noctilucicola]KIN64814.1 Aldehyde dehydrogenase [Sulfitobacter noctilucicola]MBB4174041.1 DNA helicase HerA-like ATPase [Sulfitobacter noctilucicola]
MDSTKAGWTKRASGLTFRNQASIHGKFVDAASDETFQSINPANAAVLADVGSCDVEDVNLSVSAARSAFDSGSWSRPAPIREDLGRVRTLNSLNMGKLVTDAVIIDPLDPTSKRGAIVENK